jgi:ComF family protein
VIVPVPLHPRKYRERTFNQSELIAEALVRVAGGATCMRRLLRRTADTVSQTHHDRRTRQSNLKNAFALASGATINPGQHYLLVDDVFTTGSTLNSCAQALRRAGALNLDVATFGHG